MEIFFYVADADKTSFKMKNWFLQCSGSERVWFREFNSDTNKKYISITLHPLAKTPNIKHYGIH
jgi:hypothetical protein